MTDICGRTTKQGGEPCQLPAGWGTDHTGEGACKLHGGASSGAPRGNTNAYKHGAFSEHWRSDLTDAEVESLDAVMGHLRAIDDERTLAAEVAAEALLKYKRSADSRFLREARQWMDNFNLLPNEDTITVGGSDGNPLNVLINRERADATE